MVPPFMLYREWISLYPGDFEIIKMDNGGLVKVIGIVYVYLEVREVSTLILQNVKHSPSIHLNLISKGKLDDNGYGSTFSDGQ